MKYRILAILSLISCSLTAQQFDKVKLDSLFNTIDQNQQGMGSGSIFLDGEEVYQKAIGYASIDTNIKATAATKYRIGSISKTFTATIIVKLVEQGALNLNTKLSDYFPQIENADQITIEQLLRHRSGIYNFTNAADYPSWMEQPITAEALVNKIVAYGIVFKPDEKAEYSNSNYVLLSFIAEKITGKQFPDILNDLITKPCKLDNTYYGSKIDVNNKEGLSYTKLIDWVVATETDMTVPAGAGSIVSNPTDLNIFLNCLFTGKIVSEESLNKMMTIQDGYGLGLLQAPFYEMRAFGHTGGIDGFQSNAFYFPKEKVSVAYLSNGVVMPINDILIGVLSIYFGRDYEIPTFATAIVLTSAALDKYLGVYSSPGFPLKITITKNENNLIAQATGQPSFPLEAFEENKFKFDPAQLEIEFNPTDNKLILRQGGSVFELAKE